MRKYLVSFIDRVPRHACCGEVDPGRSHRTVGPGTRAFLDPWHTLNADLSSRTSPEDIAQIVEQFRETIQGAADPAGDKQDLVDEINDTEKRTPKRVIHWVVKAIKLVATSALPVIGKEGASTLMAFLPRSE